MVADADPLFAGMPLSAASRDTEYDPAAAEAGAVTCSAVDALAPGLTLNVEVARLAVQPAGTADATLKLEAAQAALLRLVTDIVRLVPLPGLIEVWEGERATVGAAGVHGGGAEP